jgi:hypothetical protein
MSSDPAARDRAMGLVKAAYASWISTSPSMSGKDEHHQEYVARCKVQRLEGPGPAGNGVRGGNSFRRGSTPTGHRRVSPSCTRMASGHWRQLLVGPSVMQSWSAYDRLNIGYNALQHATPYTRIGGYAQ